MKRPDKLVRDMIGHNRETDSCPKCGSTDTIRIGTHRVMDVGRFNIMHCNKCKNEYEV